MKKTLIAAGIAAVVAAPAAFADVKVSGVVEQSFSDTDLNIGGTSTTDEWVGTSDNSLTFKASEDLGNGMTAFASITIDADNSSTNSKDNVVGLKGAFGTVVAGRMEDFTEGKIMSRMTLEGDGSAGGGSVENGAVAAMVSSLSDSILGGAVSDVSATAFTNAGRNDDGIAYVTPTVNGFHAGIAAYALADSGATKASFADATDMAVFYDNGPISLAASMEKVKYDARDQKSTVLTGSYTMGDLKATALYQKIDNIASVNNLDSKGKMLRVDYKMGSNVITAAYNNLEYDYTTDADADVWSIEAAHNFSKRTKLYVNYTDAEYDENGSTTYDSDVDFLTVGLKHKF